MSKEARRDNHGLNGQSPYLNGVRRFATKGQIDRRDFIPEPTIQEKLQRVYGLESQGRQIPEGDYSYIELEKTITEAKLHGIKQRGRKKR